jgi:hypothetical protein
MTITKDVFENIYRKRTWGSRGAGSGLGSNLKYARGAARIVTHVVAMLGAHSLIDAPCGGREWQTPLVHELQKRDPNFRYLGLDVSETALSKNSDPRLPTRQHDLASTPLPSGYDLVLTRDTLQHNSQENIFSILLKFACSDAPHFLIGSYADSKDTNRRIKTGGYFPIDLRKPPYSLEPWKDFAENTRDHKHLYLYNRSQLTRFGQGCGSVT